MNNDKIALLLIYIVFFGALFALFPSHKDKYTMLYTAMGFVEILLSDIPEEDDR